MGGWGFDDDGQRRRRDGESQSLHHEFAAKRNEVGEEAAREAATMVGVPLTTTTAISHRPDQRDLHRAGREQVRELVEAHGAAGDGGPRGGEGDQVRGGEELAGEAEAHHISPQAQVPAHAAELLADVHALHGALAGGGGAGQHGGRVLHHRRSGGDTPLHHRGGQVAVRALAGEGGGQENGPG